MLTDFGFLGFKVVQTRTMNLFKNSENFEFSKLSGWIEKYKPALSKSDFSLDYSFCVRLVIVIDYTLFFLTIL